jgi:hypothetical protein
MTCGSKGVRAPAYSRIVKVNPKKDNGNWVKPVGTTPAQFSYWADLDIDVLEQPEVDAIARIC